MYPAAPLGVDALGTVSRSPAGHESRQARRVRVGWLWALYASIAVRTSRTSVVHDAFLPAAGDAADREHDDGREDAEDQDDDEKLDQGEAALRRASSLAGARGSCAWLLAPSDGYDVISTVTCSLLPPDHVEREAAGGNVGARDRLHVDVHGPAGAGCLAGRRERGDLVGDDLTWSPLAGADRAGRARQVTGRKCVGDGLIGSDDGRRPTARS